MIFVLTHALEIFPINIFPMLVFKHLLLIKIFQNTEHVYLLFRTFYIYNSFPTSYYRISSDHMHPNFRSHSSDTEDSWN